MGRRPKTLEERFWKDVSTDSYNKCWTWRGALTGAGYGHIHWKYRNYYAHRLSWEFHNGKIPKGMHVLHRCDNPACVNPGHLFLGTHRDNMIDRDLKGRCNASVRKLWASDVKDIRAKYATGEYSQTEIANEYGVGQSMISRIVNKQVKYRK